MDVYFITGNTKKFHEFQQNISPEITLIQKDLDTPEIQTTSLKEISKDKAIKAFKTLQKPLIVEDTGGYFDYYDQFPGALAKFAFTSLGFEGFKRLLDIKEEGANKGSFVTVISYMDSTLNEPIQCMGEIKGEYRFDFLENIEGEICTHMPYNYIFVPEGKDKPCHFFYNEFIKDHHRARAVRELNIFLNKKKKISRDLSSQQ